MYKEVFKGEYIQVWIDDDQVFIAFPWVVLIVPEEHFYDICIDFDNLLDAINIPNNGHGDSSQLSEN